MKKKAALITAVIIILAILGGCIYIQSMFNMIPRKALPKTDEELGIGLPPVQKDGREGSAVAPQTAEQKGDVINIALFGLDRRDPDEGSRSDSIIIISIDRKNKKIMMTSLMRDMYIPIPGKGDNRINAAYAFGGPALSIKTINSNFELDVRDYVSIDFPGLVDLIDKVGGVEIDIKPNEAKSCNVDKPGLQKLNGTQALAYSRIRYIGNGDFERTERQRRVLNELYKKIKSQGIGKLPGLILSVMPYVETSLSNGEISKLAMDVARLNVDSMEQFRIPVDGAFTNQRISGMEVLVPDIEENKNQFYEFIYGKEIRAN